MERVLGVVAAWQFRLAMAVMGFMPFPIAVDIIGRTCFHAPLPGCMEIEEFCMVLLLFLSLPFTELSKTHISIDVLTKNLPEWQQKLLDVAFSLMSCVFLFTASWWAVLQAQLKADITTAELLIPIWPFMPFQTR